MNTYLEYEVLLMIGARDLIACVVVFKSTFAFLNTIFSFGASPFFFFFLSATGRSVAALSNSHDIHKVVQITDPDGILFTVSIATPKGSKIKNGRVYPLLSVEHRT